jgi:penicillin-binding protein 2
MRHPTLGVNVKKKSGGWKYAAAAAILILAAGGALYLSGALRIAHIGLPPATPRSIEPTIIHPQSPESAARAFLDGWNSQNYAGMYALLAPPAKDGTTAEQFQKTYQDVWNTATIRSLEYRIISIEETATDSTVTFEVTLHTILVGDIVKQTRMLLKNQDGEWKVAWDEQTILPDLQNGNTLIMNRNKTARGNIYDRNGLALAADAQAVEIGVIPGRITDEETMLSCLSSAIHKPRELIRTMYDVTQPDTYFPIGDVNQADIGGACSFGTLSHLDGVQLSVTDMRYYYGGGIAAHVVGYTQQLSPDMLSTYLPLGYAADARVGASGVEKWGEQYLAGREGGSLQVTTSTGTFVNTLAESQPEAAMSIYTTLDRDLQTQIERTVLGQFAGAVVVLNRNTGEVLAMTSSPGFDSNYFNPGSVNGTANNSAEVRNYLDGPQKPLYNRAAQGLYPLGSVFKIITMATALQSGSFDATSIIYDDVTGHFTDLPGYDLTDWTIEKEMKPQGKVNLEQCLERSCNTCFWHVALDMYYKDAWLVPNMAAAFGLGQATGIRGVDEEAGLVPNPEWSHDTGRGDWTGIDALNQAIGQGSLDVTPLQVADFVAAVGNGGTLYRPQVIYSIRPAVGDPVVEFSADTRGILPLSQENLQAIQKAMTGVITDPKGTARPKFYNISDRLKIAGKTGTAQTQSDQPDAWFVAYTYDNFPNKPDIAVAVIVENVGEGSTYAAPMVRRVLEIYFDGRPETIFPWESTYGMRKTDTPVESETPTETPTETPEP